MHIICKIILYTILDDIIYLHIYPDRIKLIYFKLHNIFKIDIFEIEQNIILFFICTKCIIIYKILVLKTEQKIHVTLG